MCPIIGEDFESLETDQVRGDESQTKANATEMEDVGPRSGAIKEQKQESP